MPENIYLTKQREKYDTLKKNIASLQARAAEAKRDLTNEELRSVIEQGEMAKTLYAEIETLSEAELRNAKVEGMNAKVDAAITSDRIPQNEQTPPEIRTTKLGGAKTQDRDPGIYIRGGAHQFFADQYRSQKMGDQAAAARLTQHSNAMRGNVHLRDVLGFGATTFGAGLVPPVWLAELYAPIFHRQLRLAPQLRQVPWSGPQPWTIPVAATVAKTSSVAEGVNTTETDPSYVTVTVTPKAIMGFAEVSRQMLEMSNPAVDSIIWGDLIGDFYDNCELEVISALNAQSGVNAVTVSAGALTTTDILAQRSGILDGIAAISDAPAGDPDFWVGRTSRWTTYLKFQDTVGRPLILAQAYNPQNAIGAGGATQGFRSAVQGSLESLQALTSPTVAASTGFILNSQESIFSVSTPMEFSYEQPIGPANVRVGIFGYEAVSFARRPKSITKITYSGS